MVGKILWLGTPVAAILDSWAVEEGNVTIWKLCKLWKGVITKFLGWKLRRVDELEEEARVQRIEQFHEDRWATGSWNPPAEKRAQTGGCCPVATVLVRRTMHCICSGMPHGMVGIGQPPTGNVECSYSLPPLVTSTSIHSKLIARADISHYWQ